MKGIKQVLDVTASIACLVICALLLTAVAGRYLRARADADAKRRTVSAGIELGSRFPPIPGFDYKQHDKSILFFVSADCSHCIRSLPLYQRIFDKAKANTDGTRALLGLFEDEAGFTDFVARGFSIPGKTKIQFYKYNIRVTPTIVVVDRSGNISNFWMGELTDEAEKTLTHLVESNT